MNPRRISAVQPFSAGSALGSMVARLCSITSSDGLEGSDETQDHVLRRSRSRGDSPDWVRERPWPVSHSSATDARACGQWCTDARSYDSYHAITADLLAGPFPPHHGGAPIRQ